MNMLKYYSTILYSLIITLFAFSPPVFADCQPGDGRSICNKKCTYVRTADADWAMKTSGGVVVDTTSTDHYISFTPTNSLTMKETGFLLIHDGDVDWSAYSPMVHWAANAGYRSFLARFGESGDVCLDIPFITQYERLNEIIAANPNITKWVLAGHSLGGVLASHYVLDGKKSETAKIKGITYWGAYSDKPLNHRESLLGSNIDSSLDGILKWDTAIKNAGNYPVPTQTKCIEGGNHSQYGWYGHQKGDKTATISRNTQQGIMRTDLLAFLGVIENGGSYPANDNAAKMKACQQAGKKRKKAK